MNALSLLREYAERPYNLIPIDVKVELAGARLPELIAAFTELQEEHEEAIDEADAALDDAKNECDYRQERYADLAEHAKLVAKAAAALCLAHSQLLMAPHRKPLPCEPEEVKDLCLAVEAMQKEIAK